ncbi:MAG: tetratricopeptide repeat protein [bacterium]
MTTNSTRSQGYPLLLVFLLCLIIGASSPARGESTAKLSGLDRFKQATEYYGKQKYSEAIQCYLDLIRQGYQDPFIYYNLGNAYFKNGELGRAILYYEKASRLLPRDEDIQKNLAYAHSLTVDKIESHPSALLSLGEKAINFLTLNELTLMNTGIYLILVLLGILIIRKKEESVRKRLFHLLTLFLAIFILAAGVLFYRISQLKTAQFGVIISKAVEIKSGPEENLATLFSLHEGTTFSIHQQRGDWLQITIKNGLNGWVQSEYIQKISF